MNRLLRCAVVVVVVLCALPQSAFACLHPEGSLDVQVRQSAQEAIILHHQGVEDLLIRINYNALEPGSKQAKVAGKVTLTAQVAKGSCGANALARARKRLIERWRGCYAREARDRPNLRADVSIKWSISPSGRGEEVRAVSFDQSPHELKRCLGRVVSRWRFPKHRGSSCVARVKVMFEPEQKPKPKGSMTSLAWVIPVPNPPSHYEAVPAQVFNDVNSWLSVKRRNRTRGKGKGRGAGGGSSHLRFLQAVEVGPFKIQPIQARGSKAGRQLNRWMVDHRFKPLPLSHIKHYTDRRWTFLAVRMAPPKSASSLSAEGELPGLAMTFKSPKAIYPLKLSTNMGKFSMRALLVTREQQTEVSLKGALERGFEVLHGGRVSSHRTDRLAPLRARVSRFKWSEAPATLRPILRKRFGVEGALNATILVHESINTNEKRPTRLGSRPAKWPSDLSIPSDP